MRKYQQLLLVIVSLTSITILLMYKSENNRLKYVLQVVNFFGRSDAAVLDRIENNTRSENYHDFSNPLPVWQHIGANFHAYSSFWEKKELAVGGETTSIVVSPKDALISFKCGIRYKEGKVIAGKFAFVRIETTAPLDGTQKPIDKFSVYKFLCKVSRDFGTPESLIFTDTKAKSDQELVLRHIKNKELRVRSEINVCLNMAPYNGTVSEFSTKQNLMQFFLYHQAIGVENFLIYNADALPIGIRKILQQTGVHLNYFPYNFPFDLKSPATRTIIELDCLLRSMNTAQNAILLEINEFFYVGANLREQDSVLQTLKHFEADVNRFDITTFSVCLDHRNKLLVDNTLFDPERKIGHKISVYKPTTRTDNLKSMPLAISHALGHVYVNCLSSKDLLYDWRSNLRDDFLRYIENVRKEISFLF